MLWRNGKNAMLPVADFKNRLVVYKSYALAEVNKPALGVVSPVTRQDTDKIVKRYDLTGIRIRD